MLQVSMRRLQVFVAVVDNQGFGAAAEALDIAQSSVSAHIRAAEDRLGTPLFERQPGRPPRLTEAGKTLYEYAIPTLAGFRVMRVWASARWPATCSCGQLMTRIPHSIKPSSAGLQNPPESVKTCSTPFSIRALANMAPPRSVMFVEFDMVFP
jgi:hypothetical protein